MGYAYLEDSDDIRDSPSARLVTSLEGRGAQAMIHDPHVPAYAGDWRDLAPQCDAVVFMVRHTAYRKLDLVALQAALRHPILIDGRAVFEPETLRAAGWHYIRIGLATPTAWS
jgi:UDP-N-acetyl-D-mannosaminuronate dehydrogenase